MTIDIVILTYGRSQLFDRCLSSLLEAATHTNNEVCFWVVVNGYDRETELAISRWRQVNSRVSFVALSSPQPCGYARNSGIVAGRGEWVYFIDDDAFVADDFFSRFEKVLSTSKDLMVVGGPNVTPKNQSAFQRSVGQVVASKLASGPFSRRYRVDSEEICEADDRDLILCNLFVKRAIFSDYRFPFELSCAEENHLIDWIRAKYGPNRIVFSSDIIVFHERAHSFKRFAMQTWRYAVGRGEFIYLTGLRARSSQLVVFGAGGFAALLLFQARLYFLFILLAVIFISIRHRSQLWVTTILLPTAHVLYFCGLNFGFARTFAEHVAKPLKSRLKIGRE